MIPKDWVDRAYCCCPFVLQNLVWGPELQVRSYFVGLGCFRDGIIEEQKAYQRREQREDRSMYGPYLAQLPADMLAVITMHRLMGLLMSDMDNGSVKVVHAAIQIGEAVEQEVRIHELMKKKKKHMELKTGGTERSLLSSKGDEIITGQNVDITSDSIREKVKKLVKQNKLRRVDSILRHASTDEPWTAAIHVKV
jgi:DNA-directed RNA polymerase